MKVNGKHWRTIWLEPDGETVGVIDQTCLPHAFETVSLRTVSDVERAIRTMIVRGAPLIGATAAYGMALAMRADPSDSNLETAGQFLTRSRPTAVNLRWAVHRVSHAISSLPERERAALAFAEATLICEDDVASCESIGHHGADALKARWNARRPLQILTHCNAGWLAAVDWGTALAPIYALHDAGIPLHVWVDETRPRNQGASLTAWELGQHGVPHTLIVDNAGGHLMRQNRIDACIVGADRVAANGDVCNKIGTYLKALAAFDNGVPFYVAMPHSTIDWNLASGDDIPIEERDAAEVIRIAGRTADGQRGEIEIAPVGTVAANFAFDVTPARLITALVTERGVCPATRAGLADLYGVERRGAAE